MIKSITKPFLILLVLVITAAWTGGPAGPSRFDTAAASHLFPDQSLVVAAKQQLQIERFGLVGGNVDDQSFDQLAWDGLQRAAQEYGFEAQHLPAVDAADVTPNIVSFLEGGYAGIVSVGYEFADETRAAALANPEVPFINVDFPSQAGNDLGLLFAADEPAFLAGYLAAGMSSSGIVCTYGGKPLPPVLMFMVGFEQGVLYYNDRNAANVQLLGWETDPRRILGGTGTFTFNFTNLDDGRRMAEWYFDQGCDVLFPVAGQLAISSAEVAQQRGRSVIGVDADMTQTAPQLADVFLTSVIKRVDSAVYDAVQSVHTGTFVGGNNYVGTLANDGVALAPFHAYEDQIPQSIKDALLQIDQGIANGSISTGWPVLAPSTFVGTYAAETAASGGPTRTIHLTLNYDGSAQLRLDFDQDGSSILETGTWTDLYDGTAEVTLTQQDGQPIEARTIIFQLRNGQMTATSYDVAIYGPEGLVLLRETGLPGVYQSRVPTLSGDSLLVTLTLEEGDQAQLVLDAMDDTPPITAIGTWRVNGDGTLDVYLTQQDGAPIIETITFLQQREELVAVSSISGMFDLPLLHLLKQP